MGSYDNTDISYKAAGAETYHLPILYTEDERSSYAAWGIKKEKLLLPFAVATILIDAFVLCATVVYLFVKQRQFPSGFRAGVVWSVMSPTVWRLF